MPGIYGFEFESKGDMWTHLNGAIILEKLFIIENSGSQHHLFIVAVVIIIIDNYFYDARYRSFGDAFRTNKSSQFTNYKPFVYNFSMVQWTKSSDPNSNRAMFLSFVLAGQDGSSQFHRFSEFFK